MDGNVYQVQAMRTANTDLTAKETLFHAVFGMASEAGEISGLLQKTYQGHILDKDHLVKEMGDLMWFIAEACDVLNVPMNEVMEKNINKLRDRYPNGFESEKSLNRKKGDI